MDTNPFCVYYCILRTTGAFEGIFAISDQFFRGAGTGQVLIDLRRIGRKEPYMFQMATASGCLPAVIGQAQPLG